MQDYIQDDVTGLDQDGSGRFVDVLDKLRRIIKITSGLTAVIDSAGNVIDGFRLQSLYQWLEALISKSRRNPNLGKLVDIALAETHRTRMETDQVGFLCCDLIKKKRAQQNRRLGESI